MLFVEQFNAARFAADSQLLITVRLTESERVTVFVLRDAHASIVPA